MTGRIGGYNSSFFATFGANTKIVNYGAWSSGEVTPNQPAVSGEDVGVYVVLSSPSNVIEMSVGISSISIQQVIAFTHS